MEFTANIADDTKTQLNGTKVTWCAEDAIAVSNGTTVEKYTVKELLNDGKSAIFQGAKLEGDVFYAAYPCPEELTEVSCTVVDGEPVVWAGIAIPTEQVAVAGSFADGAALAYGEYQGDYTFSFTNENAVLKFQVPADCEMVEFFNGENLAVRVVGTMTAGNDYYAVVAPGDDYTFVARIDACLSKQGTKGLDLAKNNIYNLGTLPAKQTTTVNLVPGVWADSNAWFAAYYFNGSSNKMVKMTDEDEDGVYTAEIAADAEKVNFVRMDPNKDKLDWDSKWDEIQTDLPIGENNNFYIFHWKVGVWQKANHTFPKITVYDQKNVWNTQTVYCHVWDDEGNSTSWPGISMTKDNLNYSTTVMLTGNIHFIFNVNTDYLRCYYDASDFNSDKKIGYWRDDTTKKNDEDKGSAWGTWDM